MKTSYTFLLLTFYCQLFGQGNRDWATYYGATGQEYGSCVATDAFGNIYLGGSTTSSTGIANGGFQNTFGGSMDAFLVKFDAMGNRVWATYYGGSGTDPIYSIATDPSGNVYITGFTTSPAGIASGGFQNSPGGGSDAYLVKFDSNGNRLWGTYYGGTGQETGSGIAIDATGNVCLIGNTASTSGIASGGFQNTYGGGSFDAFVVKFDPYGVRLWATYYGGSLNDQGTSVAVDASKNICISGSTASTSNIASGGFQNSYGGGLSDAFAVRLDSAGNRIWATYYGGSGDDVGNAITVDFVGNIYLAGNTSSTSGIASGGFQNGLGGGTTDAFVVKLDSTGNRLWGTYYGGTATDAAAHLTTDYLGNVYLAGSVDSDSSIASGGFQNLYGGGLQDAFLLLFQIVVSVFALPIMEEPEWTLAWTSPWMFQDMFTW
ncbi:MAG TPA: SBBP repeat-containing protein [Bacteroidia bacterium]|nr:SBBP repeat-containing protein [Bacteroidia bacterium]